MAKDIQQTISSLHSKIEKLAHLHSKLKDDYEKLGDEHNTLIKKIEGHKNYIRELEEKNKVFKIARSMTEAGMNPAEVKITINEFVREIDKCIALLNK